MLLRRASLVLLVIAGLGALTPIAAGAKATGLLDPTFGTGGISTVDLSRARIDVANAARGPYQGGPVLVGSSDGDFALASTEATGLGDGKGQVTIPFDDPSAAYGLAPMSDQQLVVVGQAGDDFAVVRVSEDGVPVPMFGDLGQVRTSFGRPAVARDVITRDQVAIVAGTVGTGADADIAIVAYDGHGELDAGFGVGGMVVTDVSGGEDAANAIDTAALADHGHGSVIAGRAGGAVLVARFGATVVPDTTFGVDGEAVLDITPGDDVAYAVEGRDDGRTLVAGAAGGSAFVARLTPAGALDSTFGVGGVVLVDLGPGGELRSLEQGSGDVIVAGGTAVGPAGSDGVIVQLTSSGAFDPGFGTGGRAILDFGSATDRGNALFRSGAAGSSPVLAGGDGADMRVGRVDLAGNVLAPTGQALSRIDFSPSSERASAMAVQPDGKLLVAGGGSRGMTLMRFHPGGSLDAGTVAAGAYHSLVRGRDGVVQAWGWNGYGQLGTGTAADSAIPVVATAVPATEVVTGIAGGALHTVAY